MCRLKFFPQVSECLKENNVCSSFCFLGAFFGRKRMFDYCLYLFLFCRLMTYLRSMRIHIFQWWLVLKCTKKSIRQRKCFHTQEIYLSFQDIESWLLLVFQEIPTFFLEIIDASHSTGGSSEQEHGNNFRVVITLNCTKKNNKTKLHLNDNCKMLYKDSFIGCVFIIIIFIVFFFPLLPR